MLFCFALLFYYSTTQKKFEQPTPQQQLQLQQQHTWVNQIRVIQMLQG